MSCELLVPEPDDAVPGRAPRVLHNALLRHSANRSVVVIGDASTDLVTCLSHVALSATALTLEASDDECAHLQARAARHRAAGHLYSVSCSGVLRRDGRAGDKWHDQTKDADLFVFSQASWRLAQWKIWARRGVKYSACRAHLGNCDGNEDANGRSRGYRLNHIDSFDILTALRRLQLAGHIRATAQVAMIFDEHTDHDAWSYAKLYDHGWLAWNATFCVPQHELRACIEHAGRAKSKSALHICSRHPQSKFLLAGGPLVRIPRTMAEVESCEHMVGFGTAWTARAEADRIRSGTGGVTPLKGLSAAIDPSGRVHCGAAANRALERHVSSSPWPSSSSPSTAWVRPHPSRGGTARARGMVGGGLLMIHSHRQVASEYVGHAATQCRIACTLLHGHVLDMYMSLEPTTN